MVFHIGSQEAGNINNVAGDLTLHGGQFGTLGPENPLRWATELAQILRMNDLDRLAVDADTIRAEVRSPEPDRAAVADRLIKIATAASSIAAAGVAWKEPVLALAEWLGELGVPILQLIG